MRSGLFQIENKNCQDTCSNGGKCEGICGDNGYCCSKESGNCPRGKSSIKHIEFKHSIKNHILNVSGAVHVIKKMNETMATYACARRVPNPSQGYVRTKMVGSTVSLDFSMMNTTTLGTSTDGTRFYENDEYDNYEVFANTCCLENKEKIRIGDVSNTQTSENF